MRTTVRIAAATLALGLLFTGCSKSKSDSSSSGDTKTTAPAASGTEVTIKGFKFDPTPLKAKVGDTITWTNKDSSTHEVKSTSGPAEFDTGKITTGKTGKVKLTKAGKYEYECSIHPTMKGEIDVS
jgi:plastocyanin